MKALVLAGGLGSRLRPFSHSLPKQLIPIANKPVIVHVVEGLRSAGVTQIGLIVGDHGQEIAALLGDGSAYAVEITYIRQDAPRGLAHCVEIAREFLGADDFVMFLGDNVLADGFDSLAEEFRSGRPAAQVTVHKVPDPRAFGVAEVAPDGRVRQLVEKPEQPRSDLAVIGLYFFTPAIHEAVAAVEPSARGELEITDALQWLVSRGADVRAAVYSGFWKDTGNVDDVLDCNREVLGRIATSVVFGSVDGESTLVGPVVVEDGARVIRSRIVGPAIVGAGSVVADSSVGAHTSIGRDCVLRRAGVAHSIMLDGASIQGVDGISGSVLGRSSSIASPLATGSRRFVVGDHSRVEVAARPAPGGALL